MRRVAGRPGAAPHWAGDTAELEAALSQHRGWLTLAAHAEEVPGLPAAVREAAEKRLGRARRRQVQADADLAVAGAALDAAHIPWACFKGPVLSAVYARVGVARSAIDLDLLVPPDRLGDALRALSATGGGLLSRNFTLLRREVPGEVAAVGRHGTSIDLHWTMINRSLRRQRATISTADLLRDVERVPLGSTTAPVLQPDVALAHVCLHAALAGASRVSWLLDVALSVQDRAVDWDQLIATARAWGVPVPIGLVLQRSATLVGTPVPPAVLRSLLGRDWALAERLVGRTAARATSDTGGWPARLSTGALEDRRVVDLLLRRARRRLQGPSGAVAFVQGPEHPGSTLYPSGDPTDLAAYLTAVSAEAA
ncbi:hypothetical protein ASG41_07955 [Modestobacter sp. Leaf380]|nr:hypothetical protein ASG41_07955 [Modestobacter sp. Leaf380]